MSTTNLAHPNKVLNKLIWSKFLMGHLNEDKKENFFLWVI
jgi:hypothetical protein